MNELTFSQRLVARILMALLLIFFVVTFLLQYFSTWLSGRSSVMGWPHAFNIREFNVVPIHNPCVLTRFTRSSATTSGYPLRLETSSKSDTICYILYDINVEQLHHALLDNFTDLIQFFRARCKKQFDVKIGNDCIEIEQFEHQLRPFLSDSKRTLYPLVVGFVSDCCQPTTEKIVACCYVIHLRLDAQEPVDTGVMYTFWKTNWNRLLTPQAVYAARDNSANTTQNEDLELTDIPSDWTPSCFICLNDVKEELRVLLPCRHAGLCVDCFKEFRDRMTIHSHNPLSGMVCPLCRTTITAIMKMTRASEEADASTGDIPSD